MAMWWAIVGLVLVTVYFYVWGEILFGADDDDVSIRDYERQRDEFERWFE